MFKRIFLIIVLAVAFSYAQESDTTAVVPEKTVELKLYQDQVKRNALIEKAFLNEFLRAEDKKLDKAVIDLYIFAQGAQVENRRLRDTFGRMASELILIDNKEVKAILKKYGIE